MQSVHGTVISVNDELCVQNNNKSMKVKQPWFSDVVNIGSIWGRQLNSTNEPKLFSDISAELHFTDGYIPALMAAERYRHVSYHKQTMKTFTCKCSTQLCQSISLLATSK